MKQFQLGFIGCGKMATAIASGIVSQKLFAADQIIASATTDATLKAFNEACGAHTSKDNNRIASEARIIILGVKPQKAEEVCLKLEIPADAHVISIAAGLKVATLKKWLKHDKISRVMPNTPLMVGIGASAYCSDPSVSLEEQQEIETVFGCAGIIHKVEENDIDAVTGVSGSGPAYVFEFIQALANAGSAHGLDADISLDLAVQTVAGAAQMLRDGRGTPEELRNAVTSPNGTTYAALENLKSNNFRRIISSGVDACVARSIELGKSS